jgi:hypothetical protein
LGELFPATSDIIVVDSFSSFLIFTFNGFYFIEDKSLMPGYAAFSGSVSTTLSSTGLNPPLSTKVSPL